MENVRLRSSATQAKIIGAIVSISGALVVVLYKGPTLFAAASVSPTISLHQHLSSSESSWIIGGLLITLHYFLTSVWYILQVQTLEKLVKNIFRLHIKILLNSVAVYMFQTRIMEIYPEEITVVFLYNLCVTLISAPVCLLGERNFTSWTLKPDISLAAIMYSVRISSYNLISCNITGKLRK